MQIVVHPEFENHSARELHLARGWPVEDAGSNCISYDLHRCKVTGAHQTLEPANIGHNQPKSEDTAASSSPQEVNMGANRDCCDIGL